MDQTILKWVEHIGKMNKEIPTNRMNRTEVNGDIVRRKHETRCIERVKKF